MLPLPKNPSAWETSALYRMRADSEKSDVSRVLCARAIKPFERGRSGLRRTRALCKFNCGKERCRGVRRLGRGAQLITREFEKRTRANACDEKSLGGRRRMRWLQRGDRKVPSTPRAAELSSWREWFHAAAVNGGERSWISAAVRRSMIFIGPPHLGQSHWGPESLADEKSCSSDACCSEPSK